MKTNYIDLHVSLKMSLVVALLKKKCLFAVAFPVHFFFLNVFIFLIDSFFKTHFKIKPSHMQDSVLIYLSFNVIFKIKIKVIFIYIFF